MSELKVNKISPRSGTAVTLGDSGDTFTIPSGATLAIQGSVSGFTSAGIDDNATSVAITISSDEDVTFTEDILLGDSKKAIFGAGSDLQIYHDGSNSIIQDVGTGKLIFRASTQMLFQDNDGSEAYAKFTDNGSVELYYDNAKKFETTSTGATVTGGITTTTSSSFEGGVVFNDASADVDFRVESNGNANMLFVDGGNDKVGIGTASPSEALDVVGNAKLTSSSNHPTLDIRSTITPTGSTVGGRLKLSLGSGSNSGSGNADTQAGDKLGSILFNGQGTDFSYQAASIEALVTTGDGDDVRANQGVAMTFGTKTVGGSGFTEKMRLNAEGNLGIGTSSVLSPLHVASATSDVDGNLGSQAPQMILQGGTGNQNNRFEFGMDSSGGTAIGFLQSRNTSSGAQNLSLNPKGGNVGIGISPTPPSAYGGLHIHSQYPVMKLSATATGSGTGDGFVARIDSTPRVELWNFENSDMVFATNNTERMRILSGGNVGIGTTSPSQKLEVNGTVKATSFTGSGANLTNLPASGASYLTTSTTSTTSQFNPSGSFGTMLTRTFTVSSGKSATVIVSAGSHGMWEGNSGQMEGRITLSGASSQTGTTVGCFRGDFSNFAGDYSVSQGFRVTTSGAHTINYQAREANGEVRINYRTGATSFLTITVFED